jgi:uncharacterized protein (DUF433 family)
MRSSALARRLGGFNGGLHYRRSAPPCIRGLRVTVADILGLMSAGQPRETILQEYPYPEDADIDAVLAFAARQADHPIIAAE